jgi:hypothetical protein
MLRRVYLVDNECLNCCMKAAAMDPGMADIYFLFLC